MLSSVGWGEMGVLLVLGLFLFGPERLPTLAQDLGRTLRKARELLHGLTADLKAELGPEVGDLDLASLHPKRIMADLMREDETPLSLLKPARPAVLAPGDLAPWDPDTT